MSSVQPRRNAGYSVVSPRREVSGEPAACRVLDRGTRAGAWRRSRQPLGQVFDGEGVSVFDAHVRAVEELEGIVGDPELLEREAERLRSEIEIDVVAIAGVDVDRPLRAQRVGVAWRH